jgi:hypothetical protein
MKEIRPLHMMELQLTNFKERLPKWTAVLNRYKLYDDGCLLIRNDKGQYRKVSMGCRTHSFLDILITQYSITTVEQLKSLLELHRLHVHQHLLSKLFSTTSVSTIQARPPTTMQERIHVVDTSNMHPSYSHGANAFAMMGNYLQQQATVQQTQADASKVRAEASKVQAEANKANAEAFSKAFELLKQKEDQQQKAEEERRKADDDRRKADEERQKAEEHHSKELLKSLSKLGSDLKNHGGKPDKHAETIMNTPFGKNNTSNSAASDNDVTPMKYLFSTKGVDSPQKVRFYVVFLCLTCVE